MVNYFERLAAYLATQGVPDCGVAAVEVGDSWVVVEYNCDGRLSYHRTQGEVYPPLAPFVSYEGGPLEGQVAQDLEDFLTCRWVELS